MVRRFVVWMGCVGMLCAAACGEGEPGRALLPEAVSREAERWSDGERPASLGTLEYRIARLPRAGSARQTPWPGSHWPLSEDGLNARWDGPDAPSAIEKLGRATNRPHLEDRVSAYYGLDLHRSEGSCYQDRQCPRHKPKCGKRRGAHKGVCVGTWWGVCHGWSPAAIAEVEPQHAVTYNGVEFKVNDIKALLTLAYASAGCTQLGTRSETGRLKTDGAGRALEPAIRQVNAGTFHVMLANLTGKQAMAFTLDRDLTYRVFNHPVMAYKVLNLQQVTETQAMGLLNVGARRYPYASRVSQWFDVSTEVTIVMDTQHHEDGPLVPNIDRHAASHTYRYILEADADGTITGGEWVGDSKLNHPDFVWRSYRPKGTHRAGGAIALATIFEIAQRSRE